MVADSILDALREAVEHQMKLAEAELDVADRYFYQRQAELYLKRLDIEVRIKGLDNLCSGLYKIAERLR